MKWHADWGNDKNNISPPPKKKFSSDSYNDKINPKHLHSLFWIHYVDMNSCFMRYNKLTTANLYETAWEVSNWHKADNHFSPPHCISLDDFEYFGQSCHLSQQFNILAPLNHRGERAYFSSLMFLHTVWVPTVLRNLIRKGSFLRRSNIVLCNFFHESARV
jgi:hypothetical protein